MKCGLEVNLGFIEAAVDQYLAQDIGDGWQKRQGANRTLMWPSLLENTGWSCPEGGRVETQKEHSMVSKAA